MQTVLPKNATELYLKLFPWTEEHPYVGWRWNVIEALILILPNDMTYSHEEIDRWLKLDEETRAIRLIWVPL